MTNSTPDPARAGRFYYLFRSTNPLTPNTYKPGITDDVEQRWRNHGKDRWELIYSAELGSGNAYRFEQQILSGPFSEHRLNERGEYLGLSSEAARELVDLIKAEEQRITTRQRTQQISEAQELITRGQKMLEQANRDLGLERLTSLHGEMVEAYRQMTSALGKAAETRGAQATALWAKRLQGFDKVLDQQIQPFQVYASGGGDLSQINQLEDTFRRTIHVWRLNTKEATTFIDRMLREEQWAQRKRQAEEKLRASRAEVDQQVAFMQEKKQKEEAAQARAEADAWRRSAVRRIKKHAICWSIVFGAFGLVIDHKDPYILWMFAAGGATGASVGALLTVQDGKKNS